MASPIPQGTVTLLFTDREGSSTLWEQLKGGFLKLLEEHNALIRQCTERWNGYEVKTEGDRFMLAFQRATDAVQCAIDIQLAFARHDWGEEVGALKVRIGVHTGEPFLGYDPQGKPDYFGPAVNRAARICDAGHGGQILLSSVTASLVRDMLKDEGMLLELGEHRLRGLEHPERLFQIVHSDLPQEFPPLQTLDAYQHNLPLPLSSFVGREKELATLRERLLVKKERLTTVMGIGGCGKSRLALELAQRRGGFGGDGLRLQRGAVVCGAGASGEARVVFDGGARKGGGGDLSASGRDTVGD